MLKSGMSETIKCLTDEVMEKLSDKRQKKQHGVLTKTMLYFILR